MNKKIVLELTIDELNQILSGLGKLPYEVSVHLINKLVKTTQDQLKEQE